MITYHAFLEWLHVGVDIFFVISGYLIAGIILKSLEKEQFCFVEFYNRRILRLFPALFLVLATVLGFGWFALFPNEYEAVGKNTFGGAFLFQTSYIGMNLDILTSVLKLNLSFICGALELKNSFISSFLLSWFSSGKKYSLIVLVALFIISFF